MSTKVTPDDAQSIIATRANPYALQTSLAPVDLATIRERIDPQGKKIQARDLVDKPFTIVAIHPFQGTLPGSRETIYHVRGVDEAGELFHTTLGGSVVCEWLDTLSDLTAAWAEAKAMADDVRVAELEAAGAGRPVKVTLRWHTGGTKSGYYEFE
jgi:hypothetical protein